MSEEIDKLATQHKVIGVKTDCPHFNTIGNLCSRIENGMARCDEYSECEFKYIDALKEENTKLKLDLDLFRKAHDNEQAQRRMFEQKLEQIKNAILYCGETDYCSLCKFSNKYNGNIEEVILKIIEGAEDE